MAVSTYQDGVKYLKISKVDAEGIDNSNSLSSLQDVRIKFSDRANSVQYNVLAITEYPDYYQYRVTTNPITSSADDFRADYDVSASYSSFPPLTVDQWNPLDSAWDEDTDTLNIFDSSDGTLTFPYSSNTVQELTITVDGSNTDYSVRLVGSIRGVVTESAGASISTNIIPATETYTIEVKPEASFSLTSVNFNLTPVGSYVPQAGVSTPLLFEPYLPAKFEGTDCDVLYGNVLNVKLSNLYMDVDYSSNQIQAVNQEQLINNTATRAIVQDYNYYLNANLNSKYKGAKNESQDFNVKVATRRENAVEQTQEYFAYFNWVGGTAPEWGNGVKDRTVASIGYLINSQGEVLEPIEDTQGIFLGNLRNNFPEYIPTTFNLEGYKKNLVSLSFDSDDASISNFANLIGKHPVFKSGYDIRPVIYTQTESMSNTTSGGYTSSIYFTNGSDVYNPTSLIDDFEFVGNVASPILLNDSIPTVITFDNITYSSSAKIDSFPDSGDNGIYSTSTDPSGSNNEIVTLKLRAYLQFNVSYQRGTYALQKSGSATGGWIDLDSKFVDHDINNSEVSFSVNLNNVVQTDHFRVISKKQDIINPAFEGITIVNPNVSYFKVLQFPTNNKGEINSFWNWSGSGDTDNVIKSEGNQSLLRVYGKGLKQLDIADSGFYNITEEWDLTPQDIEESRYEIRFESTEELAFTIMEANVTGSGNDSHLRLVLDRDVPRGTNLDFFLIRVYRDNPKWVILDVDKSAGDAKPGFLLPEYPTKDIKENFDSIVKELKTTGLI